VEPKPPVLWLRGADDVIVSDTSLYDLAYLGSLGAIPGWPGEQTWPPQPMVAQTRSVLRGYAAAGGRFREVVIDDAGHGPHLDQPERFLAELRDHLAAERLVAGGPLLGQDAADVLGLGVVVPVEDRVQVVQVGGGGVAGEFPLERGLGGVRIEGVANLGADRGPQ
jgi:hypothetical protein